MRDEAEVVEQRMFSRVIDIVLRSLTLARYCGVENSGNNHCAESYSREPIPHLPNQAIHNTRSECTK